MKIEKFIDACLGIFSLFDKEEKELSLSAFIEDLPKKEETYIQIISFSIGYAIGQAIDITDNEVEKDVKYIIRILREKHLLPYLPREKAA